MPNELKVGDIVEHVHGNDCVRTGSIGVISLVDDKGDTLVVRWMVKSAAHEHARRSEVEYWFGGQRTACDFKVIAHAD